MATTETITVASTGRGSTHNTLDGSAADSVTVSVPSERMTGQVGRCIVRSGFAGTVVADFDSSLAGPTGYTDAYGNVWTIS